MVPVGIAIGDRKYIGIYRSIHNSQFNKYYDVINIQIDLQARL